MSPAGDSLRGWASICLGALAGYLSPRGPANLTSLLVFIDVFYVLFVGLTWHAMRRASVWELRRWALVQDIGGGRARRLLQASTGARTFSGGIGMLTIVSVSGAGVGLGLYLLPILRSGTSVWARVGVALCAIGVVAAWALLHTSFALYYAHLYYRSGQSPGGLVFPGDQDPDAADFAYYAFTVGTTFAASDVSVVSRTMRRKTLIHSVLSFFYNTAILALVFNLVLGD